jgi:hypothetical protein
LIRYSMQFASWKERKALAKALKLIYAEASAEAAAAELEAFEQGPWGKKSPAIVASWRRRWAEVIPFFAFSPEVRKIIYTTNAIEPAQPGSQGDPEQRTLSERRVGNEADLSRRPTHRGEVETTTEGMTCCQGTVRGYT